MSSSIGTYTGLSPLITGPVCFTALILVIRVCSDVKSVALRFLAGVLLLRFSLSALHYFTFQPSPVGLSWNALGSISVVGLGAGILRKRDLRKILPLIAIIIMVVFSGIISHSKISFVEVVFKYLYLVIIVLATLDALEDVGARVLTRTCLLPFCLPIFLQFISVIVGSGKGTEDGSGVSYIGGYYHESAFSMMIISGFLLAIFSKGMNPFLKFFILLTFLTAIFLANYRTAILGIAPMLVIAIGSGVIRRFVRKQSAIVFGAFLVAGGLTGVGAAWLGEDRFADIATVTQQGPGIIKPPENFTVEDRHVLSGRTLIWSRYIYAYRDSSNLEKIVGHGPESWIEPFGVYAHNTLISTLYEYGLVGILLVVFAWLWTMLLAFRAYAWREVAANLSFIILNMATMPMWQIEGLIFYAMICAFSIYAYQNRQY